MKLEGAQSMNFIFPASYLSSQLNMTGFLVALGLSGNPQLAADVAIVQGAALALFYAFSGNVRNLIFKPGRHAPPRSLLIVRLALMLPLGVGVYYLGSVLGGVAWDLALVLILRKSVEWLNEIRLSEAERDRDVTFAWKNLILQSGLLILAVLWTVTGMPGLITVLAIWALTPVFISVSYLKGVLRAPRITGTRVRMLLPHLGSTAVMGIGVYVFRLTLLLLIDKATAGELFTAFAIGGVLGSVFAAGLGPSMVLHEQRTGQKYMPSWLRNVLIVDVFAGLAFALASHFAPGLSVLTGKDPLFWQALGLSLIGGVVMVLAQRQRLRDLQNGTEDDVFAPDVLVNILIVAVIPFVFFAFGRNGLSWLYLFNALVALIFYWMTDINRAAAIVGRQHVNKLRAGIAVLLVSPIFVSLNEGLFRGVRLPNYDSGGDFGALPIPLSVFGCYLGIALLGNYRRANLGLAVIFLSFVLMALSTVTTSFNGHTAEQAKLILLMQYMLPMFGLVLGMMYEERGQSMHVAEKAMLAVVAVIVPLQLLAGWAQGYVWLTSDVYFFTIYQHLQYVQVIIVGAYLVALYSLWNQPFWRRMIIALAPAIGIYVAASASMLATGFVAMASILFAIYCNGFDYKAVSRAKEWMIVWFILISWPIYYMCVRFLPDLMTSSFDKGTYLYVQKFTLKEMPSVQGRIEVWQFYLRNIFSSPSTFLFGHGAPPDRMTWASAHNYYLDFMYNFGSISVLVIVGLVIFTILRLYQNHRLIINSPAMIGLTVVVLFLLIPDNSLKVGMREPYPGIVTFFLWGLLLNRIESMRTMGESYWLAQRTPNRT